MLIKNMAFISQHLTAFWLIAGLILIAIELTIPGGFVLLLLGLAALTVSAANFFVPSGFIFQIILFVIASLMYTLLLKENLKSILKQKPDGNDPENEFKGKKAIVLTTIHSDEAGKVEFKGTQWPATSDTLILPGAEVEILEQESITLHVKPIK